MEMVERKAHRPKTSAHGTVKKERKREEERERERGLYNEQGAWATTRQHRRQQQHVTVMGASGLSTPSLGNGRENDVAGR